MGAVVNPLWRQSGLMRSLSLDALPTVNFCQIVPDGVLVFFPSYGVMADCVQAWQVSVRAKTHAVVRLASSLLTMMLVLSFRDYLHIPR